MLRLRLRVRKAEETAEDCVQIVAEIQAQQIEEPANTKERIVRISPLSSDEERIAKEIAEQSFQSVQMLLQQKGFVAIQPKPLSALVVLYITKHYFNYLGRPTVDDYIELNARTDKGH